MKIYDISQEVFGCAVFPGDPVPHKETVTSMDRGDLYNLSCFSMCAHNGTHVDAPFHFLNDGRTIDDIGLEQFIGLSYVAQHHGAVSADDAEVILGKARATNAEAARRILIKGEVVVSLEAAYVFAAAGVMLLGNESQTVGPEDAPMAVHKVLLGADVVLLEGIRLNDVPEGVYLLSAAPINLGGSDGAPSRAVLIDLG